MPTLFRSKSSRPRDRLSAFLLCREFISANRRDNHAKVYTAYVPGRIQEYITGLRSTRLNFRVKSCHCFPPLFIYIIHTIILCYCRVRFRDENSWWRGVGGCVMFPFVFHSKNYVFFFIEFAVDFYSSSPTVSSDKI